MLQHPFHPQHPLTLGFSELKADCHVCHHKKAKTLLYHCEECNLRIDVMCATLLLSLQDQKKEDRVAIDHCSHEHQLLSGQVEESNHTKLSCAACDLKISGEVYYCLDCNFFIHKLCADELSQDMVHHFHPEHRLVLLPKTLYAGGTFTCDCCGVTSSGMSLHCASCRFNLNLKCVGWTFSAIRDGVATKIQYFDHDHPLLLRYSRYHGDFRCKACGMGVFGLAYSCDDCDYTVHKSCAELPLQLEHPCHSHPLNLVHLENYLCDRCRSESEALIFRCHECIPKFDLCLKCATEMPTLKHPLHEHGLGYMASLPYEDTAMCNSCGKVDSDDFYCCRPCNFNLHRDCASLPPTIQHEWHPYHPLVLFDRFVEGLPEYQYCDICEEIRNPDHGVYRCAREECWHTVHIGCVLPQATQHEKLYLEKLSKEIASLGETIEVKEKDLVALKLKREELEQERRKISSKHREEV